MFTGIIETVGEVVGLDTEQSNLHLQIKSNLTQDLKIDQSVSHNGVCLTVVAIDKEVYTYCQKMVDVFQLNEAFVMDIALTEKGYSIVECGCINCAGFYKADMQKLLMSLEDYFGN